MTTKITRINQIAKERPKEKFTSIYHLINEELLKECFKELDGSKATGLDKMTKEEYSKDLENNIKNLTTRLKNKAYRPTPARKVTDNSKSINNYAFEVRKLLMKWLNKRSQKKSYDSEGFNQMLEWYKLPIPKIKVNIYAI